MNNRNGFWTKGAVILIAITLASLIAIFLYVQHKRNLDYSDLRDRLIENSANIQRTSEILKNMDSEQNKIKNRQDINIEKINNIFSKLERMETEINRLLK